MTWRLPRATAGVASGERMLALVEQIARQRDACKLTLEVLAGNQSPTKLYARWALRPTN